MPYLVLLGTQYRMREKICAVVNELFYSDHPLNSDPRVNHGNSNLPISQSPLLYVDTEPFHPWTAKRVGTHSHYNLFHALLIRNMIIHLAENGFIPSADVANNALGAVTPYVAQANLIQTLLDERLGSQARGISTTVHRFQGNEKDVMVIDLTDSPGIRLGKFLQATRIEEDGARLLNVAVSRARHHIILVGQFRYLRTNAPKSGFIRRLLEHFEKNGEKLDLDKLLPLAEHDWVDGLHHMLPATFEFPKGTAGAFTEGTFYPAFLRDLARARESIIIFSPYATHNGMQRWIDSLGAALHRGVSVRILTRPPEKFGRNLDKAGELMDAICELGGSVDLRGQMHEKIAIIDGRILWHGSLNILSHRYTHESMLRIESSAACQQLSRFVSTS